jgi:hypothetical protein
VRIGGQVEVYAMCAIDALGIPPMVAADAVISSTEPDTGAPVTVTFADGHAGWEPSGAVVFIARRGDGPAVKVACSYMNFFRTPATARAWARAHPGLTGRMLSQAQAERLGRDIFGSLLTSPG